MAVRVEKKFLVDSFDGIEKTLAEMGAIAGQEQTTHHYYAKVESLDVTKLVVYPDRAEVHVLKEKDGTFELTNRISVADREAGLQWFADHGYPNPTLVKMISTNYELDEGRVGLYDINDQFKSVILEFPADQHQKYTKVFGLENCTRIEQPYNKFVESMGNDT